MDVDHVALALWPNSQQTGLVMSCHITHYAESAIAVLSHFTRKHRTKFSQTYLINIFTE